MAYEQPGGNMDRKQPEALAADAELASECLSELDALAAQWATFHDRNPGNPDQWSRDAGFRAALELAAKQLQDVLRRHRMYAGERWDEAAPAVSARLSDA